MLVGIHQPHYLPWVRYFEKVARSERFILLDDVAFTKNGWQNRNRIKTAQGPQILTVPVNLSLGMPIKDVSIAREPWTRKHWATLTQSYRQAPYFSKEWESLYEQSWENLVELNVEMYQRHLAALDINVPWCRSSQLEVPPENGTARLVNLVKAVGGTAYLTGAHAFDEYLDPAAFRKAGIDLWIFEWRCPTYRQLHPKYGFVKDLATLDLLFCEGPGARSLLASGGKVFRYDSA